MLPFEWDKNKNAKNKLKHKVSFEEAKEVFDDSYAIEREATFKGEDRMIRIGKTAARLILFVVYTMRGVVVRLISARPAKRSERNLYIEHKFKNIEDEASND